MLCYKLHFQHLIFSYRLAKKGKPEETHLVPTYKAAHKALKFVSWSFPETKRLQCTQVNTD